MNMTQINNVLDSFSSSPLLEGFKKTNKKAINLAKKINIFMSEFDATPDDAVIMEEGGVCLLWISESKMIKIEISNELKMILVTLFKRTVRKEIEYGEKVLKTIAIKIRNYIKHK